MQPPTTKKPYAVIAAVCVIVIIIIGGLWWHHSRKSSTSNSSKAPQAVVDITPSGFVPATLHVKSGTPIVWQNQDSATHKVASNPYPTDDSVPGLNSGSILPNGSYRYTPGSAGTIQYHDDTKPTLNGTIVVTK